MYYSDDIFILLKLIIASIKVINNIFYYITFDTYLLII